MSYSFIVTKATKGEVETGVREELAKVVELQPVHAKDSEQAIAAAKSMLDLVSDDAERDTYCSLSGSIWSNEAGVQDVSVNVRVGFADRKA